MHVRVNRRHAAHGERWGDVGWAVVPELKDGRGPDEGPPRLACTTINNGTLGTNDERKWKR